MRVSGITFIRYDLNQKNSVQSNLFVFVVCNMIDTMVLTKGAGITYFGASEFIPSRVFRGFVLLNL